MQICYRDILDIRYIKLHFKLNLTEGGNLPSSKTSAIRGGMGEMLLRANCIRNRDCDNCDFESECIVQRTMYSKLDKKPSFMKERDSVGYVIECENYGRNFNPGDILEFNLILFGKTIVYFSQFLNAFYALGQNGIGTNKVRFTIEQVTNTTDEPIMDGNNVIMANYEVHRISDYVDYRLKQIKEKGLRNEFVFKTLVSIKYNKEFMQSFNMEAVFKSLQRRIYMLDCFENIDAEEFYEHDFELPETLYQENSTLTMERYSSRTDSKMGFKGIKGMMQVGEISDEIIPYLLAGEILHIGKNTSFGFGRYRLN